MANEFRHKDVGNELSKDEWKGILSHIFNSQAAGDVLYASSTTQLTRLAKGNDGEVLTLASGIPSWAAPGGGLTVAETEVFNGTSPTAWTDLNLAGTIGANPALVLLKIDGAANLVGVAVRKNSDGDEFYSASITDPYGCAFGRQAAGVYMVLLVATDASGIIEWKTGNAKATTIDIIAYIK